MHVFATDSVELADRRRHDTVAELSGWLAETDAPAEQRVAAALEAAQESVRRCLRLDYRQVELEAVKAHAREVWRRIASDPITDHVCRDCGARYLPRSGGVCPCELGS